MEQIVKLLVATTIVTVFGLVLTFAFVDFSKNGGEFWGFDGRIEPSVAAANSFKSGDYRFLFGRFEKPLGDTVHGAPSKIGCTFHDPTTEDYLRVNALDFENGVDSTQTAFDFAQSYNQSLSQMLKRQFPTKCGRQARTR